MEACDTFDKKLSKESSDACCISKKPTFSDREHVSLSKYYLFFSDLLTWKYPRLSGSFLGGLLALLIFSTTFDIPRLILRTAWIVFASSTIIEVTGRVLFKQPNGFISQFAPSTFYSISPESFDNIGGKICEVTNFALYGIQELLFAKKIKHTVIAFVISWTSFILIHFLSFIHVLLLGILFAFTVPLVYIKYQKIIDFHIKYFSTYVSKYSDIIKKYGEKCAKKVAKKLSSDFVKLSARLSHDINRFKNGFVKNKASLHFMIKNSKLSLNSKKATSAPSGQDKLSEGAEKHDTSVSVTK